MKSKPSAVAIVTHFPFPQNHGDALRRLMLLKSLERKFDLTVLAVEREDTKASDREELVRILPTARVESFPLDSAFASAHPISKLRRLFRGLRGRYPSWMLRQWSSALVKSSFLASTYDFGFLVGEPAGLYVDRVSARKMLWDKSNVLAASEAQNAAVNPSRFAAWRSHFNFYLSRSFEAKVLEECGAVWVTSEEEEGRLKSFYAPLPTSVLPSAIPLGERFPPQLGKRDFIWMSTFGYEPNWRGLTMLLEAIDERLLASGRRLHIFGGGSSASQRRYLRRFRSAEFHGFVEDLHDMHKYGSVAIVPIWSGAGVKLKTLALMEQGFPVIATPIALEGIDRRLAYRVADDVTGIIEVIDHDVDADALLEHAQFVQSEVRERYSERRFAESAAEEIETFIMMSDEFKK